MEKCPLLGSHREPPRRRQLPAPPERPLLGAGTEEPAHERGLALEERKKTRRPRLYKVLLHNDDFTTMEFVVEVLVRHFKKSQAEAAHIMLKVHHEGVGVAGVYTYEVAETKVAQVTADAQEQGMPLKVTAEPS